MFVRTFLIAALLWPTAASAQPTAGISLPAVSIAEPDGVNAVLHNPAGLSTLRSWELRVYNTQFDDQTGEGTALLLGAPVFGPISIGGGLEFLRPPGGQSVQRLSLGVTYRLHRMMRLGLMFRHLFSDDDRAVDGTNTLDFGLLMRPASWLSVGLGVHDINTPVVNGVVIPRVYDVGLGFHPGTDRVSIEATTDIDGDGATSVGGPLRFEPIRGLEILGRVRYGLTKHAEGNLEVGTALALHFGPGGVDGGVLFRGDDFGSMGFTVGARLSGKSYGPLYKRSGKTVLIELGGMPETPRPGLSGGGSTYSHVVNYLDRVRLDDTVSGVLIKDVGARFGWAQAEELRDILGELRKAGKQISVYLDQGDMRHLYLYSGADRIYLNPAGGLMLVGLKTTLTYYRDVLDRLMVDTQWVKFGKFKSYPESFSRSGPSEPALSVRNSILDTLYDKLMTDIAAGRKLTPAKMRAIVDGGPYLAADCKAKGLVDHLAFYDEVEKLLRKELGSLRVVRAGSEARPAREPWAPLPRIAVIPIEGSIVDGRSSTMPLLGTRNVGDRTIVAAVKAAARNRNVKGIVLRINSPGGSSVASDHMHRAILKAAEGKPVVASMGNVAASGGYYVAMGAKEVLSGDMTVTGSIGIFTGKPAFGRLYAAIGIGRHTLARGKNAELFSQDRPWTDAELKVVTEKVKSFYDLFLKRVADGRKMTVEQVHEVAQGRVWMGSQARKRKLTDARGGMLAALRRAKALAGMSVDDRVALSFYPRVGLVQRLRNTLGIEILLQRFSGMKDALAVAWPFLSAFKPGEPLAMMPYRLTIE